MYMVGPEIVCVCCGEMGEHAGRRLRKSCYTRYRKAGTLDQWPRVRASIPRLGRLEDYAEMRGRGLSLRAAAGKLDVSLRTVQRYEAWWKTQQEAAR